MVVFKDGKLEGHETLEQKFQRFKRYVTQDEGVANCVISQGLLKDVIEYTEQLEEQNKNLRQDVGYLQSHVHYLEGEVRDCHDCMDGKQP